jgi:hypothetical protein
MFPPSMFGARCDLLMDIVVISMAIHPSLIMVLVKESKTRAKV